MALLLIWMNKLQNFDLALSLGQKRFFKYYTVIIFGFKIILTSQTYPCS